MRPRPDLAIPAQKVWWKFHGRPEDPGAHSDLVAYWELVWLKQAYNLSRSDFIDWAQTPEGRHELAHWTSLVVAKQKESGHGRISDKMWSACPEPAMLERESGAELLVIELDDKWCNLNDYVKEPGVMPTEHGYHNIETLNQRKGKQEAGWLEDLDALCVAGARGLTA